MSVEFKNGIACQVPPAAGITVKKVGGFMAPEIKGGLQELGVVFDSKGNLPNGRVIEALVGDSIFVAVEALAAFPWAKTQYQIDGETFIVVPVEFVVGVRT